MLEPDANRNRILLNSVAMICRRSRKVIPTAPDILRVRAARVYDVGRDRRKVDTRNPGGAPRRLLWSAVSLRRFPVVSSEQANGRDNLQSEIGSH